MTYTYDFWYGSDGQYTDKVTVEAATSAESLRIACHVHDTLKALGYYVQARPLNTLTVPPMLQV